MVGVFGRQIVQKIQIKDFDFENADPEAYSAVNEFNNLIRAERLPDDPPIPVEETIQKLRNMPKSFMDLYIWLAKTEDGEIAGMAGAWMPKEENLHLADFDIRVRPTLRRRGLGKRLLEKVVEAANRNDRRLLLARSMASVPDGEKFLAHIGAEVKQAQHINQLKIEELDRDLLVEWQRRARERAADFELGWWLEGYPQEEMDAVLAFYELGNQEPRDDLDVEDFHFTEEQIREIEKNRQARGEEHWTLYARHKKTGAPAGFTEVFWNPNRPQILEQGGTAVFPEFRNKGLGRWLKAAMLEKVLADRAEIRFVRTGNADSNAPMLKINTELGFRPYIAESVWQLETEKAARYLAG